MTQNLDVQRTIQHSKRKRRGALTILAACAAAAAICIPLGLPTWQGWNTGLVVVIPLVLAVLLLRESILGAAYLFQVGLYFGVTSWILGSHWSAQLDSLVLSWSLAITAGSIIASLANSHGTTERSWRALRWPHYLLALALISVNAYLSLSEGAGYAAQITTGRSSPTGLIGYLAVAAPIVTLLVLLSSIRLGQNLAVAASLAIAQTIVLALSGFRGASGVFIITALVVAALVLPSDSSWRSKRRLALVIPAVIGLTVLTFVLSANVKNSAAAAAGVTSSGTDLFTWNNALVKTATRLQLSSSLDTAIENQGDSNAIDAVSWERQLVNGIPRFLWPGKPDSDYGQRVSVAMYGLTYGQSSSTITTVGDCLLNFGRIGTIVAGLIFGYALGRVQRAARRGRGLISLIVAIVVAYAAFDQEQPLVLMAVGIVQRVIIVAALWWAATFVARLNDPSSGS